MTPPHVLVFGADDSSSDHIVKLLSAAGATVASAQSADQALALCDSLPLDAVQLQRTGSAQP